jgi:hypothetical protein
MFMIGKWSDRGFKDPARPTQTNYRTVDMDDFNVPSGIVIRALKWLWGYVKLWFWLPKKVEEIEAKLQDRPPSREAKFCPDCDARMQTVIAREVWVYKCAKCDKTFRYPGPTANTP